VGQALFKGLVIQNLYGLSDDQLEYQIEDRRSFQRFLGLNNHQRSPDAKTFWAFRHRLSDLKLIRRFDVTDASVHDSNVFEQILDANNSRADVWADSAYRSKEKENNLSELGYRSQVHRKGKRGTPLSDRSKKANTKKSTVRCRVEHVFGSQSNLRKKAIRSIGIMRARTDIGLMNIVYNMRRFCFLQRMSTP